jgi:hypothetical protein
VLDFFGKVANLLVDIYGLPFLLAGQLWNKIPSCIRDPFVDWIIPLILRQIDIFKELVKDNEAWQKTKADVMNIIRLVFVNKDLKGAIKATFHLILRVFNVPVELLVTVVQKAQAAWETVTAAPIKFLKNCVKTIGLAFLMYWQNLSANLMGGIEGWLFGEVAEKGITKPKSWTDPWDLFQFALDIMGISMDHVFELMEKGDIFTKPTVDKLRVWWRRITRVWDWISEQRGKSPAEVTTAILDQAADFGTTILEGIVGWIVEQVSIELAEMATAAAASAGLSEVLDAVRRIYRAMKTAVKWMRTILEMVNTGLDAIMNIAAGVLAPAAQLVEGAMKRGTPAVIGFLADQVGLGGIGDEIRTLIDKLRAKVDAALIAIMKKLKSWFAALVQGAKDVAAALLEWWKEKLPFKIGKQPHELMFQGEKDNAVLMVKSTPEPLESVIGKLKAGAKTKGKEAALKAIEDEIKNINKIKKDTKGGFGQEQGKAIRDSLKIIADNLAKVGLAAVPPTKVKFKSRTYKGESIGQRMEANPLSIDPGGNIGSEPAASGATQLWFGVNRRPMTYVQGHLLNHHLHGSGANPENLVPITRSANTTMESRGESKVKEAVLGQSGGGIGDVVVARYVVEMTGKQTARKNVPEESELPAEITMQAWRLVADGNDWKDDTVILPLTPIPNTLPPDTPAGLTQKEVDLSSSPRADLETIPGIGPVLADRIMRLRRKFDGRFNTYDDLLGADGIGGDTVDELRAMPYVKLRG